MLDRLEIENFRGVRNCLLDDIAPVTLISGKNDAGKSTVLDAIYFLTVHSLPYVFEDLNALRAIQTNNNTTDVWTGIFNHMNPDLPVSIRCLMNDKNCRLLVKKDDSYVAADMDHISPDARTAFRESSRSCYILSFHFEEGDYKEEGHFITGNGILRQVKTNLEDNEIRRLAKIRYINNSVFRYGPDIPDFLSKVELAGKKEEVIQSLKVIDPEITDIVTLSQSGVPQLFLKKKDGLIPIQLAGDGINKLLFFIIAIMNLKNGILLFDEIDTGFHYSVYQDIWKMIRHLSKAYHCQVIATTHSYECIQAFSESDKDQMNEGYRNCYYRIEKQSNGDLKTFAFNSNNLRLAMDSSLEIR